MYKASVVVLFVLFCAVASSEPASPVIISNYNLIDSTEATISSTIDPAISDEINLTTVIVCVVLFGDLNIALLFLL